MEERTVFLLQCADRYALTKRTEGGLLAGLWQLPNVPEKLDANQALQAAGNFGIQPVELCRQMHRVHILHT